MVGTPEYRKNEYNYDTIPLIRSNTGKYIMNEKNRATSFFEKQVSCSHYEFNRYMDQKRWASLWHQLDEILQMKPKKVLEIGTGTGVLGALLKHYGVDYFSVDIDPELRPDYVAPVTDLPLEDNSFDVVACFQVLEHLPFDQFSFAIRELVRVSRDRLVISLPDAKTLWSYRFYIPKKGMVQIDLPRPRLRPKKHVFDGEHYWEINTLGFPINKISQAIKENGANIIKNYRSPDNTYHRFFVLDKDPDLKY